MDLDFGYLKPCTDNNKQLDYLHDDIHQVNEGSINGVISGDCLYNIPPLETCYQIAGFSFYQNIEDEAYNMAMVPSIMPKMSCSSSSSSSLTVMEDRFLGFREYAENKMVIKTVRRNLDKNKKKTNMVKGQWTLEEDRRLIKLVEKHGIRKWSHIAQMLPGRIGKQCRERWHNHLRPNIKKDSWNEEEDKVLIEAHKEVGNKWAEIAKRLPGRTENSLKNHWNTTKRRQFARRHHRTTKNFRGATNNTILQDYIRSLGITNNNNMPPPTPTMPISIMPPGNGDTLKSAKIEKVEKEVEVDMLPSGDLFADMYSLLFDGNDELVPEKCVSSFDITGNVVFDKIDEVMMEMVWDVDELVYDDSGMVVMPDDNEIVVKKEMDLMEMISENTSTSNCAGYS
ncbi:MYB transcription factor-like protein [Carex littledalei]|uniref:MYB transcription factor-like protein n=1 Tax=Carex littledalei TaxID=544730 RepID=A0A833VV72_9POAL|nr:MYB transcription factor-like protein [Carex littledalei]